MLAEQVDVEGPNLLAQDSRRLVEQLDPRAKASRAGGLRRRTADHRGQRSEVAGLDDHRKARAAPRPRGGVTAWTADAGFDAVEEIRRVDPLDAQGVTELLVRN